MRPIPVAFHIWFIEIHTYGIGLALTFWFGLRYTERRLRNAGYPWQWVTGMFLWVIVAAIVGARALHVLSNLSYYSDHPGQVVAIWQGGLSSFGGLLFAVPVAIVSQRRRCPELPTLRFADLMAPVLMASWGIGRLLGPQLMVAGGGHPTHQWFGMYYAGQVGKRLPVPIFQAMEDFAIFGVLLLVERWLRHAGPATTTPGAYAEMAADDAADAVLASFPAAADRTESAVAVHSDATDTLSAEGSPGGRSDEKGEDEGTPTTDQPPGTPVRASAPPPAGIVLGVGMVLWGVERFADEHLWLGEDGHLGSLLVQWAGVLLAVAGVGLLVSRVAPFRRWLRGELADGGAGPVDTTGQTEEEREPDEVGEGEPEPEPERDGSQTDDRDRRSGSAVRTATVTVTRAVAGRGDGTDSD